MKHFYYIAPVCILLSFAACGSPNGSKSRGPQKKLSESFYGSFGNEDTVIDLTAATTGSKSSATANEEDELLAKVREEELLLEKERQKLLAAKTPTLEPSTVDNKSQAPNQPQKQSSTSNTTSYNSSNSRSTSSSYRTNSYQNSPVSSTSRPSSVNYKNYQYNSSYNYATSKGRLTALNKGEDSKLKKYNVIIASLRLESGKTRLSKSFDSANEKYILARSGGGLYTFVIGSFENRGDAIAYRNKIINKYTSRYSENELFRTFGIPFTDAWILEI